MAEKSESGPTRLNDCEPCPFCNRKEVDLMMASMEDKKVRQRLGTMYLCRCNACGDKGPCGKTKSEAISLWDERSIALSG